MKDFFANPQFQEQLRHAADEAREHVKTIQPVSSVNAGDSFLFSESLDHPVRWVAIVKHKDNPSLWFLVAADDFPFAGSCDIELPESNPMAPLVLRCSVGFWAHADDVELDRYVGRLNNDTVADAKNRLSEMVHGDVPVTESGIITDRDSEYVDWISEIAHLAEQIESRLQSEPVLLRMTTSDTSWTKRALVAEKQGEQMSLAADAAGQQPPAEIPPGIVLPSELPGVMVLQRDGDKLDLVYFPSSDDDSPRALTFASGISAASGSWVQGADHVWTWSQTLSANQDSVSLVVGAEKFEIQL